MLQQLPGYVDLATASYTNSSTTAAGAGTLSASVSLLPGETIWIEAILSTPAPNGEVIDVSHTFVTGWNDPRALLAASSVPEPSVPIMWGIGIGMALIGVRRFGKL